MLVWIKSVHFKQGCVFSLHFILIFPIQTREFEKGTFTLSNNEMFDIKKKQKIQFPNSCVNLFIFQNKNGSQTDKPDLK